MNRMLSHRPSPTTADSRPAAYLQPAEPAQPERLRARHVPLNGGAIVTTAGKDDVRLHSDHVRMVAEVANRRGRSHVIAICQWCGTDEYAELDETTGVAF